MKDEINTDKQELLKQVKWKGRGHGSTCSMIKEGTYPEGLSREDVKPLVNGTFGGKFDFFGGGKFRFVAYTD